MKSIHRHRRGTSKNGNLTNKEKCYNKTTSLSKMIILKNLLHYQMVKQYVAFYEKNKFKLYCKCHFLRKYKRIVKSLKEHGNQ